MGERYVPLGSTDHAHVIEEICTTGAESVCNSLIGPSNTSSLRDLLARDPSRRGRAGHVLSFNQTEADLDDLGPAGGRPSVGGRVLRRGRRRAPSACRPNLCAKRPCLGLPGERPCGGGDLRRRHHRGRNGCPARGARGGLGPIRTATGNLQIDPVMRHAALAPRLALAEGGRFGVIDRAPEAVPADPYLARQSLAAPRRPDLRIVK